MNDSKEHILLTSLKLFMQKGFKEVTMKEIVEKTGLSKGAFYHYFSSKEQVFAEVIDHFFMGMMTVDYSQLSQTSLKAFYGEILVRFEENEKASQKRIAEQGDSTITGNYYYLIFDAMRMLPDFQANHQLEQKAELKAWKNVIATAKANNEIKTQMGDEQIAKLFIYLGDGTNINLVTNKEVNEKKNELKNLWNGLYNSLKA